MWNLWLKNWSEWEVAAYERTWKGIYPYKILDSLSLLLA